MIRYAVYKQIAAMTNIRPIPKPKPACQVITEIKLISFGAVEYSTISAYWTMDVENCCIGVCKLSISISIWFWYVSNPSIEAVLTPN